jgi:hypothetical protein
VAKNEREILREWASIVSEIPEGMFGPKPGEKEYRPMDLGGGSGQFGGGGRVGGAGGKIEPTLSVPSGPKPRYRKEGEKWVEVPQTKKTTEPTSSGKIEPRLDEPAPSSTAAAKDPNAINFKKDAYNAAKAVVGDTYKGVTGALGSKPVRLVRNTGLGLGAGALGLSMLQDKGETAADTANRLGRKAGGVISDFISGAAQGTGDVINKREREAGVDAPPSDTRAFDQAVQDFSKPDGRLGPIPDGNKGLDETRIFTQHPVSGQIVQLNVNNISRVVNQTFYESYECGAGDSAQWQCQIWSSTPVSKLLKGRS